MNLKQFAIIALCTLCLTGRMHKTQSMSSNGTTHSSSGFISSILGSPYKTVAAITAFAGTCYLGYRYLCNKLSGVTFTGCQEGLQLRTPNSSNNKVTITSDMKIYSNHDVDLLTNIAWKFFYVDDSTELTLQSLEEWLKCHADQMVCYTNIRRLADGTKIQYQPGRLEVIRDGRKKHVIQTAHTEYSKATVAQEVLNRLQAMAKQAAQFGIVEIAPQQHDQSTTTTVQAQATVTSTSSSSAASCSSSSMGPNSNSPQITDRPTQASQLSVAIASNEKLHKNAGQLKSEPTAPDSNHISCLQGDKIMHCLKPSVASYSDDDINLLLQLAQKMKPFSTLNSHELADWCSRYNINDLIQDNRPKFVTDDDGKTQRAYQPGMIRAVINQIFTDNATEYAQYSYNELQGIILSCLQTSPIPSATATASTSAASCSSSSSSSVAPDDHNSGIDTAVVQTDADKKKLKDDLTKILANQQPTNRTPSATATTTTANSSITFAAPVNGAEQRAEVTSGRKKRIFRSKQKTLLQPQDNDMPKSEAERKVISKRVLEDLEAQGNLAPQQGLVGILSGSRGVAAMVNGGLQHVAMPPLTIQPTQVNNDRGAQGLQERRAGLQPVNKSTTSSSATASVSINNTSVANKASKPVVAAKTPLTQPAVFSKQPNNSNRLNTPSQSSEALKLVGTEGLTVKQKLALLNQN